MKQRHDAVAIARHGNDMTDRVLTLEGIRNFRDYGGYRGAEGMIRSRLLWRSGQHGAATPGDLTRVATLGIATVIDLRGDSERRATPCLRHDDFAGDVLFAAGETAGQELSRREKDGRGITDAADARAAMIALYAAMPFRPVLIGALRLYFEALATREGPSLLHCLAGKDRTGLTVALLQSLLGVHTDDVTADYLLTNSVAGRERWIEPAASSLRARYGARMDDAAVAMLMGVDAAYLDTAMAALRERHGGVEQYAEEVLGVDAARRAALAERLIE